MEKRVISLANNKFVDFFKLKAYADDKINVTKKKEQLKFVLGKIENKAGKRENCSFSAFFPFPTMFSEGFFFGVNKVRNHFAKG